MFCWHYSHFRFRPSSSTLTITIPSCPSLTEEARKGRTRARSQSTLAQIVENIMPQAVIYPDTDKLIGAWTQPMQKSVTFAVKCTWACPPSPCTFSHTISTINVNSVGKLFLDPGCCRVIWDRTPVTSLILAMFVENHLLTDQI